MKKIELLSPARDLKTGIEAVNCGADAVYIGAESHGARHAACNSLQDIKLLVDYAHRYGVKIYVTLNTIIYDNELEEVKQLAEQLYSIGVDALITQDLALLEMHLPIPLHASTQMDNRTPEKIKMLYKWGFEQAVLARELSLGQIREIHKACPNMKLESFVHGALCVSYSGKCYASQNCFKRSANRGECAQFCRLAFNLEDDKGQVLVKNKYLLSLKDMNRSQYIEEMIDAGVCSFKIEGRLKDIAYVKNTTLAYRRLIDEIISKRSKEFQRSSYGTIHADFTPDLKKSFNRGFTNYFLNDKKCDVASIQTPKAVGEFVGQAKEINNNFIIVNSSATFHNGDGLCFYDKNDLLTGFRVNRVKDNKIYPYPMPKSLSPTMKLYRNKDVDFEAMVAKTTKQRTVSIVIKFAESSRGFQLIAETEAGHKVVLEVESIKELAKTPQRERIIRELKKLGDSFFEASNVELALTQDYFIPASHLVNWRNELIARLIEKMSDKLNNKQIHNKSVIDFAMSQALDYNYNISNSMAKNFYMRQGVTAIEPAFELRRPESPVVIMTCKHCIRYVLGQCLKNKRCQSKGITQKTLPVNLRLALPDGRKFPLVFDCKNCEMTVLG